MTGRPAPCQPALAAPGQVEHGGCMGDKHKNRDERLAAALRENLKRRKAQARAAAPKSSDERAD